MTVPPTSFSGPPGTTSTMTWSGSPETGSSPNSTPPQSASSCRCTSTAIGSGGCPGVAVRADARTVLHGIEEGLPPGDVEHRGELPGHRRLADVLDGRRGTDDQRLPVLVGQTHPRRLAQVAEHRRIEMGIVPTHRCGRERTGWSRAKPGQDRHPADRGPRQVGRLGAGQRRVERPRIVEPDDVGNRRQRWRSSPSAAPARYGLGVVGHRRRTSASANSVESIPERTAAPIDRRLRAGAVTEPARPCELGRCPLVGSGSPIR